MRFLADECVSRRIVEELRARDHDVVWVVEARPGESDSDILQWSWEDARVLVTDDWDFGELAIRYRKAAFGIVIVAISQFAVDVDDVSEGLAGRLTNLGEGLIGRLTILEVGRARQRDLVVAPKAEDGAMT